MKTDEKYTKRSTSDTFTRKYFTLHPFAHKRFYTQIPLQNKLFYIFFNAQTLLPTDAFP